MRHVHYRLHLVKVRFLFWAASGLELGSLDFCSHHALAEKGLASQKQLVVVAASIRTAGQARKAVEVELTLKARELGLSKVATRSTEQGNKLSVNSK